jgi:hypothetical protein
LGRTWMLSRCPRESAAVRAWPLSIELTKKQSQSFVAFMDGISLSLHQYAIGLRRLKAKHYSRQTSVTTINPDPPDSQQQQQHQELLPVDPF